MNVPSRPGTRERL